MLCLQRCTFRRLVLDDPRQNKGKHMIHPVAFLDIIVILAALAAMAGLARRANDYFLISTRVLLACLSFFLLLYGICLAVEWSGISSRFDRIEDYFGALLPMSWAFVFYSFLNELSFRNIQDLNTQLKQRVDLLKEAELRFRTIFDSASDGILIADVREKTFFAANKKLCDMLGYTKEELQKLGLPDIHPEASLALVNEQFDKLSAGEISVAQNIPLLKKDQDVFFSDVSASLMTFDKKKFLIGIFRDITERRKAEEKLLKSEKKFSSIFHLNPNPLAITDVDTGTFVDINQAFVNWTGYSREEIIGFSAHDLHLWVNLKDREKIVNIVTQTGEASSVEIMMRQKSGQIRTVLFSARFIEIEQTRYLLTLAHDISERKQAEEQYRNIFENAQEGIYRATPEGRFILANRSMARILGYDSQEDLITEITDMASQIYLEPQERTKLIQVMEQKGSIKNNEIQFRRKDDRPIWVSQTMQAVRNEKGQIIYYEGIIEDITERKENVERLRRALGGTVKAIATLVETRDPYTAGHQRQVSDLARAIATEMGLPNDRIEGLRVAATIHDIGKVSIPAEILSKPSKLTNLEFDLIKTHSQSGYDILQDIEFPWPVAQIVCEHHERINGSGYPNHLKGDEILLESRILSVADVVEAIASHRPYRASLGIDAALAEIEKNKGVLYDAGVVDACLRLFRQKDYQLTER
jgi:PAS domain S-box-containing protein/putative nucleotidyltransferase with HDIG domain